MDRELLKLYAEYEKYNTELPWLRNEYNFLVESIESKTNDLNKIIKQVEFVKSESSHIYESFLYY